MRHKILFSLLITFFTILTGCHRKCSTFRKVACVHHKYPKNKSYKKLYKSIPDNFYEIEKKIFYRSKQLTAKRLGYFIDKFNIKTVINLRGKNEQMAWWQAEQKAVSQHEAQFYNIPMSAQRFPDRKDLLRLLHLYKQAPKPILIHCNGGADRTGEAAALWILEQQKKSKKEALQQLRAKYSHLKPMAPKKRKFIKMWNGKEWARYAYNPNKNS